MRARPPRVCETCNAWPPSHPSRHAALTHERLWPPARPPTLPLQNALDNVSNRPGAAQGGAAAGGTAESSRLDPFRRAPPCRCSAARCVGQLAAKALPGGARAGGASPRPALCPLPAARAGSQPGADARRRAALARPAPLPAAAAAPRGRRSTGAPSGRRTARAAMRARSPRRRRRRPRAPTAPPRTARRRRAQGGARAAGWTLTRSWTCPPWTCRRWSAPRACRRWRGCVPRRAPPPHPLGRAGLECRAGAARGGERCSHLLAVCIRHKAVLMILSFAHGPCPAPRRRSCWGPRGAPTRRRRACPWSRSTSTSGQRAGREP